MRFTSCTRMFTYERVRSDSLECADTYQQSGGMARPHHDHRSGPWVLGHYYGSDGPLTVTARWSTVSVKSLI
eukprot:55224-Eustigmatos_ZCMA.PRE.1